MESSNPQEPKPEVESTNPQEPKPEMESINLQEPKPETESSNLHKLPYEILVLIAKNLTDYKDVSRLSQTSKRIHQVLEDHWEKYALEDKDGWKVLCWAIRRKDNHFVKYLLGRDGIDVNYQDSLGLTPLHWAVRNPDDSCVVTAELLIEAGADITLVDNAGLTSLQWAVQHNSAAIVPLVLKDLLLKNKAINIQDRAGQTALHRAAGRGDLDQVESLLYVGADVGITCEIGRTPLLWAAARKSLDLIKLLVEEHGSDVHHVTDDGRNVISMAATEGTVETLRYFASKNVDFQLQDMRGRTPLHWAAMYGNGRTFRALLKLGADFTIKNEYGQTVKDWAQTFPTIGDALRDHGVDVPKLSARQKSRFSQYTRSFANRDDGPDEEV